MSKIIDYTMYNFTCIILCAAIALSSANIEYYWKDYFGWIPENAFPGGMDADGEPTFIGQSFFPSENFLIPTVISRVDRLAVASIGDTKLSTRHYTKILCTNNPSQLTWVPTDAEHFKNLTECEKVPGGFGRDKLIYIGRANIQGSTVVGRVYDPNQDTYEGVYIHDVVQDSIIVKQFEILTFNCEYLF